MSWLWWWLQNYKHLSKLKLYSKINVLCKLYFNKADFFKKSNAASSPKHFHLFDDRIKQYNQFIKHFPVQKYPN